MAPGETITYEGLPFTKSDPQMTVAEKRQKCKWCPKRQACHYF